MFFFIDDYMDCRVFREVTEKQHSLNIFKPLDTLESVLEEKEIRKRLCVLDLTFIEMTGTQPTGWGGRPPRAIPFQPGPGGKLTFSRTALRTSSEVLQLNWL